MTSLVVVLPVSDERCFGGERDQHSPTVSSFTFDEKHNTSSPKTEFVLMLLYFFSLQEQESEERTKT